MLKKNWFIFAIILIYILFLCKDGIIGLFDNTKALENKVYEEKLKFYQEEYASMQSLLDVYYDLDVVYSRLITRDIYAFYEEITIGKGSSDGLSNQDLVVSEDGVIGLLNKVSANSSTVMLLTNSSISLSVKINGAYGILSSTDNTIVVQNIKLDQDIAVGDAVYTSGLTSIPGDMLVGYVSDIKTDSLGLEYLIEVKAAANIDYIQYVAIFKTGEDA